MDTTAEEELLASFMPDVDGSIHVPRIHDYMTGTDAPSDFVRTNLPEIRNYLSENTTPNTSTDVGLPYSSRPLKEITEELKSLRIENFDLKLSIFFMQRKYHGYLDQGKQNIIKLNIDMKKEITELKSLLSVKEHLLKGATLAMEEAQDSQQINQQNIDEKVSAVCQAKDEEIMRLKDKIQSDEKAYEETKVKFEKAIEALVRELRKYTDREESSPQSPRQDELDQLHRALSEKEQHLQDCLQQLKDQEGTSSGDNEQVEMLRQLLGDRDADIERANQMLLTTEETINVLENEAKEKDDKLQQLQTDLERSLENLEALKQENNDKGKKLQELASNLKASQLSLEDSRQKYQDDIAQKETTIRQLRDELELKDATHHVSLRQNAIQAERQVLELQAKLKEEEGRVVQQKESFEKALVGLITNAKEKESTINDLTNALEQEKVKKIEQPATIAAAVETFSVGCQVRMRDHPSQGFFNGTITKATSSDNEELRQQVAALEKEVQEAQRFRSPVRAKPMLPNMVDLNGHPRRITVSPARESWEKRDSSAPQTPSSPGMKFLSVQARARGESPSRGESPTMDSTYNANSSYLPSFYKLPSQEVGNLLPDEETLALMSQAELLKVIQDIRAELINACSDNLELARELQEKKEAPQQSQNVRIHLANLSKEFEAMKRERDRLSEQVRHFSFGNSHRSEIQFVPNVQNSFSSPTSKGDHSAETGKTVNGNKEDGVLAELREAKSQVQLLESKLLATEATVRCQADKMKSYRSMLEEAGLVSPRSPPRSRSESNISSAAEAVCDELHKINDSSKTESAPRRAHSSADVSRFDSMERLNASLDGSSLRLDSRDVCSALMKRLDEIGDLMGKLLSDDGDLDKEDVIDRTLERVSQLKDKLKSARGLADSLGGMVEMPEGIFNESLRSVTATERPSRSNKSVTDMEDKYEEAVHEVERLRGEVDRLKRAASMTGDLDADSPLMSSLQERLRHAQHKQQLYSVTPPQSTTSPRATPTQATPTLATPLSQTMTPSHDRASIERQRHATNGSNGVTNNFLSTLNSSLHSDKSLNSLADEAAEVQVCFGEFLKASPNSSLASREDKRHSVNEVDGGGHDGDWSYLEDISDYQKEIVTLRTRLNATENLNKSLHAELSVYDTIHNTSVGIQSSPSVTHDASQVGNETTFLSLEEHLREIKELREKLIRSQEDTDRLHEELRQRMTAQGSIQVNVEIQKEIELLNREMVTLKADLKNAKKREDKTRQEKEEAENALNKALLDVKRMQDEHRRSVQQVTQEQQLNQTLKMELSVYDQLDFDETDSSRTRVKRKSGADSKESIDLRLLQAMRQLRRQLERTIESERKLREQLVEFMKSGALDPSHHTVNIAQREFVSATSSNEREVHVHRTDAEKEIQELKHALKKSQSRVTYLEREFENANQMVCHYLKEYRKTREDKMQAASQRGQRLFKSIEDQLLQHLEVIHKAESNLKQCHQKYPTSRSGHRDEP